MGSKSIGCHGLVNFVGGPCIHVPQTTYMSCNSTGDGKGLEIYKGHSPLASGARQAPDFTYSHSAASTKHKHCTHKHIANTYNQVPLKHHNILLPHIDRSRGVIVANNLTTLNHNTHTHTHTKHTLYKR